jgi:class 3 adenylate cyclase
VAISDAIAYLFCALYDLLQRPGEILLPREQRKLAAILAADVVGYSRPMGRDGSGTLARLREHRTERLAGCPYRKLHPTILVMKSA